MALLLRVPDLHTVPPLGLNKRSILVKAIKCQLLTRQTQPRAVTCGDTGNPPCFATLELSPVQIDEDPHLQYCLLLHRSSYVSQVVPCHKRRRLGGNVTRSSCDVTLPA